MGSMERGGEEKGPAEVFRRPPAPAQEADQNPSSSHTVAPPAQHCPPAGVAPGRSLSPQQSPGPLLWKQLWGSWHLRAMCVSQSPWSSVVTSLLSGSLAGSLKSAPHPAEGAAFLPLLPTMGAWRWAGPWRGQACVSASVLLSASVATHTL